MKKRFAYTERLRAMREKKDILVASHRGSIGVNIPDNTKESFSIALRDGADLIELDIAMTTDGELFVFHETMEPRLLHVSKNVQTMNSKELSEYELYNLNDVPTGIKVLRLEEALIFLKDKCLINFDKCFSHPYSEDEKWERIFALVKKYDMIDQVIFKTPDDERYIEIFEKQQKPWLFMPMAESEESLMRFLDADINTVALELKYKTEEHIFADRGYREGLRDKGYMLWGNALDLGGGYKLSAGHDDTCALLRDPKYGWEWFMNNGFDLLQTDWVLAMVSYLRNQGYNV